MTTIRVMDTGLANQIAAGEVVERPASVVKELLENAIDAGSTQIDVQIEEGGLGMIKVADNGSGMSREDSRLAFERHATSKLKSSRDLFRISTLGFRGEALPSIAAVSQLTIHTWDGEEEVGTRIRLEGGKVGSCEDAPLRKGTVIEVTDLFYNTPARYKYLKTVTTELSHITDYMNRIALAYPSAALSLTHNKRTILKTKGNGQRKSVISSIYGHSIARDMIGVEAEHIDFKLAGHLGKPNISRANRSHITFMLNGRYVKNFLLTKAVVAAYHTLLPVHRCPVAVLSVDMHPGLLDVNVHPAKLEVRLSKEQELMTWVEAECKKALQREQLIPEPWQDMKKKERKKTTQPTLDLRLPEQPPKADRIRSKAEEASKAPKRRQEAEADQVREQREAFKLDTDQAAEAGPTGRSDLGTGDSSELNPKTQSAGADGGLSESDSPPGAMRKLHDVDCPSAPDTTMPDPEPTLSKSELALQAVDHTQIPLLFPLGQLHGTYILAQNENGLYMIDQHAAQERIWYERYAGQLNEPQKANQELAVPIVCEFTAGEAELIREQDALLRRMGLFVEQFGHHSYMVRSHPHWFPEGEEESLIRDMIDIITKRKKLAWIELRDEVAMMMSCKKAIKANRYLKMKEMEALLEELRLSTNPFTCPHGRPITVLLSTYDIEKMFKRVMS